MLSLETSIMCRNHTKEYSFLNLKSSEQESLIQVKLKTTRLVSEHLKLYMFALAWSQCEQLMLN